MFSDIGKLLTYTNIFNKKQPTRRTNKSNNKTHILTQLDSGKKLNYSEQTN